MIKKVFNLFLIFFCFRAYSIDTVPPIVDLKISTKNSIVIIDPGHGGGDWGVNYRGVYEKEINFKIAKLIKKKIESSNPDINVFLTRDNEEYKKPEDRVGFANNKKADLFVSIHCDFIQNPSVSGFKVYVSSGEPLKKSGNDMEIIKWKDIQRYHKEASLKLAEYLHQYLKASLINEDNRATGNVTDDILQLDGRGISETNLIYLTGLDMPAAVIEICNLNNNTDFEYLKNTQAINSIAYHIKEGIINYLKFVNSQAGE